MLTRSRLGIIGGIIAVVGISYAYADVGSPAIPVGIPGSEIVADHMPMLTATAPDSFTPRFIHWNTTWWRKLSW